MRAKKTIRIFNGDFQRYDRSLPEVVEWFTEKLNSIPEEFRDKTECEFTTDESSIEIDIYYSRPKTDDERRIEMENEAKLADVKASIHEAQERDMLARLKAKYETAK